MPKKTQNPLTLPPETVVATITDVPYWDKSTKITAGMVQATLGAVRDGLPPSAGVPGATGNSDRRVDRCLQILRKRGLIEFKKDEAAGKKIWRVVP